MLNMRFNILHNCLKTLTRVRDSSKLSSRKSFQR